MASERPERWGIKLTINLIGGTITFIVFMILLLQTESSMANSFILPFIVFILLEFMYIMRI